MYLPLWLVRSPMFGWKEILLNSRLFLWLVKSVSHPFVTYPYQETYETSIRCRQTVPPEILSCGKWLQSNGKWTPSSNKLNKLFFPNKQMEVSSSILIGFSTINESILGYPPFMETPKFITRHQIEGKSKWWLSSVQPRATRLPALCECVRCGNLGEKHKHHR